MEILLYLVVVHLPVQSIADCVTICDTTTRTARLYLTVEK